MKYYIREKDSNKSVRLDLNYYLFNEKQVYKFIMGHVVKESCCAGRKTFYLDINL